MGKRAFLFPGQGSQKVGMGKELLARSAAARAVFEEADAALGEPLSKTILDGPDDELKRTRNTQPAILTMSIAALRALEEQGAPKPDYVAGHSLGEYSALVAAGSIAFQDAVRAVRARGELMQAAVPEGAGSMAAVLGLDADAIDAACRAVSTKDAYVAVANYNGLEQTVIAGHKAGVDAAAVALKERGAKRVLPLPVSAPFHCALMQPARDGLVPVLEKIAFADARVPVVANVDAQPNTAGARARQLLIEQVTAPVRFTSIMQRLVDDGVDVFVEIGPGKALVGMVKRLAKDARLLNVEDGASLDATIGGLQ